MTIKDNVLRIVRNELKNVWTAAVAKVIHVNEDPFTCDVELMLETGSEKIQLYRVPILLTNYGESLIFSKPKVGDIVMVLFTKYNFLDTFIKEIPSKPSPRMFDISNAFILPGVYTVAKQDPELEQINPGDILIKHKNGNYIKINDNITLYHHDGNNVLVRSGDIELNHSSGNKVNVDSAGAVLYHNNGNKANVTSTRVELVHYGGNYVSVDGSDVTFSNTSGASVVIKANGDIEVTSP